MVPVPCMHAGVCCTSDGCASTLVGKGTPPTDDHPGLLWFSTTCSSTAHPVKCCARFASKTCRGVVCNSRQGAGSCRVACLHGKEHPAEAHGALAEVHVLQERPVLAEVGKGHLQQAARSLLEESSAAEQVMSHVPQPVLRCTIRIREAALLVAGLI